MSDLRAAHLSADRREVFGLLAEAVFGHWLAEGTHEAGLEVLQLDAVLRALRAGHAGHHGGEVEFDHLRVFDLTLLGHAPQALGLVVVLVEGDVLFGAAGGAEVVDAFVIDGEETHGRAVFGGHVGDGGTVYQRERGGTRAEELHEFTDDLGLAEHLSDGQCHIGGGDAFANGAGQVHTYDIGSEEIHGLTQHARLGLDAAHAPSDDAQTIDHGGVGIGAHQRVGIIDTARAQDALGQVFQVDLVDNADARRDDLEGVEGLHAPLEELVAFAVAGELQVEVLLERVTGAGEIHLHRMVHHEVDRHQGLDDLGVLAQLGHRRAHGRQVHQQRHAGEVLQDDPRHHEGDLSGPGFIGLPVGQLENIGFLNF